MCKVVFSSLMKAADWFLFNLQYFLTIYVDLNSL